MPERLERLERHVIKLKKYYVDYIVKKLSSSSFVKILLTDIITNNTESLSGISSLLSLPSFLFMQHIESLQLISLLGLGFILGIKHALDADHIVAVSTIASQVKNLKTSSLLGISWGIGHTTTLLVVSLLVLLFKIKIPPSFSLIFEFLVGTTLVVLGINMLRKIYKEKIHFHTHEHENASHIHLHQHKETPSHHHIHKSFFIGLIHGLSGSAALMLLVLATVKSTFQGLLYVGIFGIGSIIGMMFVSTAIGIPFLLTNKFTSLEKGIKIFAGSISIVMGGMIMYEIGIRF